MLKTESKEPHSLDFELDVVIKTLKHNNLYAIVRLNKEVKETKWAGSIEKYKTLKTKKYNYQY